MSAASVAAELTALVGWAQEKLHAEDVVEWARSHPGSALYGSFEWDDTKAAHEYRLGQARRLLAIHIVDQAGDRRLVSLSVDRTAGGGYRRISDVVLDPEKAGVMLQDALSELDRVRRKYEKIKALARVWLEVDNAVQKHRHPNSDAA